MSRTPTRRLVHAALTAVAVGALMVIGAPLAHAAAPTASDSSVDVAEGGTTAIDLVSSADDTDGDPLTFAIVTPPAHGTLDDCTSGSCTLTANGGYNGPDSFTWKANDGTTDSNTATVSITVLPPPPGSITSAGPLTAVTNTGDLNCSVNRVDDTHGEFYSDTACGTFLAVGAPGSGVYYSPASVPAGQPGTPWTNTAQSPVTGAGTAIDPYKVTTDVDAGATGLHVKQVDSYVVGEEAYRTDVTVTNNGASAQEAILYRAGDCYLQNSDTGFGQVDNGSGAVACLAVDQVSGGKGTRIEQWYPLSAGSHYVEDNFSTVWSDIASTQPFPDTCQCDSDIDNGGGLSWSLSLSAGQSATRSHLTTFSPLGTQPLTVTKTAEHATAPAGGADSYTITVSNPNAAAATLQSVSDTLPAGFTYTGGTTTGASTSDPSIVGQQLTWNGPFPVPAHGSATLTFSVTVSTVADTYTNSASAVASNLAVVPSGPTAPVTVTSAANAAPVVSAGSDVSGPEGSAIAITGTASDGDGDPVVTHWSATPGIGVDAGASCSFADASALSTTVTCTDDGPWTLTLTGNDGHHPDVTDTAALTVTNANPAVSITTPTSGASATTGTTVGVTAPFTDAGSNDTQTCSINWGDTTTTTGSVAAGSCTGGHSYSAAGPATITVTVTDDDTGIGTATVGITLTTPPPPANHPPVANPQSLTTPQDVALPVTLTGSDPDSDPLNFNVVTAPAHGTLIGATPNLVYTPDAGYSGPDAFTFRTNDGQTDSNLATISIVVTPTSTTNPCDDDGHEGRPGYPHGHPGYPPEHHHDSGDHHDSRDHGSSGDHHDSGHRGGPGGTSGGRHGNCPRGS